MGSAISFKRPDFHFAKPLAAKLGFATQRLLRHQRVGAGGAGMHLIVYQVVEFKEVNDPAENGIDKRLACAAIPKHGFAGYRKPRFL